MIPIALLTVVMAVADDPKPVDFAHEVVPILKARCVECHAGANRKGGLSFDTRSTMLASKGVVVPGKPAESEILKRIAHPADHDERMPPKGDRLSTKQIDTLNRWIAAGAKWDDGFTFGKPTYVAPLALKPVVVPVVPGVEHPIDRILGTGQQPRADEQTLVRRLSMDLIGISPGKTRSEPIDRTIDIILSDDQSYTEHWLTFWNDLLRNDYSGTGYIDGGRKPITTWLYRSLSENKPYDQFVRELIVPSLESEGFTRGIKWRGVVNASQVVELQFAQNVGQVFLGVNLKCASCHDSFIDSWKLTDAYGLAAVIAEKPLEIHRCDKPIGQFAVPKFPFAELGPIDEKASKTERLKRVADLLTSPKNGRFSRTIVNRIWQRLMGRAIVEPVDVMSGEPWNEDLLEYLAGRFVADGYDLKQLMKLIVTSRAYQMASVPLPPDDGRYAFRGPHPKRLTAEQFTDLIWMWTGTAPDKPHVAFKAIERNGKFVRASVVDADLLMRSLGRPNREQVVTTRPADLTTLQALDLTNGAILYERLAKGSATLLARHPDFQPDDWVRWVYSRVTGRDPTEAERKVARELLGETVAVNSLADLMWAVLHLPDSQFVR